MEYVWMVSADGVPWRIPILEEPKCQSQVEWEPVPCSASYSIRTIAASSKTAFALDRSGKVLMLVLPTHIALRQKVEVYVNQRWYPLVKWRRPLPTDRAEYSDESGQNRRDLGYFEDAAIDGWNWEEPWRTTMDPRSFDEEGWQYSITFMGAKWERQCRRHHFVRRKILKRHMRFTQHDKWIEFSSDDDSKMFVELACGGADIMEEGEILLFALGTDGEIYRRRGIRNDVPNGIEWTRIPKIILNNTEIDDITLLTISPTLGTLLCITWDGKMFHRKGVSRTLPCGASWHRIATPRNRAVINVTIGNDAMWCITADGAVWFTRVEVDKKRKEHLMHKVTETSYQEVARSGICRISITKSDQVFCVSSQNETMEVRTGVESGEPSGRKFEQLIDRGAEGLRWISIHAGSTNLDNIPQYLLDNRVLQAKQEILEFKKADWRLRILESLQIANDNSWSTMKDVKIEKFGEEYEQIDRSRKIKCQLVVSENNLKTVVLKITDALIEIEGDEVPDRSLDCALILSAFCGFQRLPQKYLLHLLVKNEAKPVTFAFIDESSRNTFQDIIDNIIRSYISSSVRSSIGQSMWTVSEGGTIRWHCLAEMSPKIEDLVPLSETRSLMVQGNFESIDCGANRLVWAVNYAGDLYTLHPKFDPLSSLDHNFEYRQTDDVTHELYEYQKAAIFRGFVTFQGQQKGVSAWMSKNDNQPTPQFYSSLASKLWTWTDSEWQLDDNDDDDEAWEYSNEIDGNYAIGVKNEGKCRRRLWRRKARYETNKSAWCKVEGPPVRIVRVAKCENVGSSVTVVVLTKHGHILLRSNVTRQNFIGSSWSQIVTDNPVTAIHLQANHQLWCLSSDSLIMSITIGNGEDQTWQNLPINLTARKITLPKEDCHVDLSGANSILYLRARNVLFRIDTVYLTCSDPYPMDNLRQAVVNSKGQICLLGSNVSIVNEWKIVPYDDNKTTIIQPRSMNRAMNFGKSIICIGMY